VWDSQFAIQVEDMLSVIIFKLCQDNEYGIREIKGEAKVEA
jgi:hypothetical protein